MQAAASVQHLSPVLCTAASFKPLHKQNGTRSEGWMFERDGLRMKYLTVVNTSGQFQTAGFNAPGLLKRQLLHETPMGHYTPANMGWANRIE